MVGRRRQRQHGGTVPIAPLVAGAKLLAEESNRENLLWQRWVLDSRLVRFWLRNYWLADRGKRNAPGGYKNTTFQARQIIIAQK